GEVWRCGGGAGVHFFSSQSRTIWNDWVSDVKIAGSTRKQRKSAATARAPKAKPILPAERVNRVASRSNRLVSARKDPKANEAMISEPKYCPTCIGQTQIATEPISMHTARIN